jgi:hypothetical protein
MFFAIFAVKGFSLAGLPRRKATFANQEKQEKF